MAMGRPDYERPGRYVRVTRLHIRRSDEIAVVLVRGERGPVAIVEEPTLMLGRMLRPVASALSLAWHVARHDDRRRRVVVIDEDGLWSSEWGELLPYRGRT